MKKNYIRIFIILCLSSFNLHAVELEQRGNTSSCAWERDLERTGFILSNPALDSFNNSIEIRLSYYLVYCSLVGDRYQFVYEDRTEHLERSRLKILNFKSLFELGDYITEWPSQGLGDVSLTITIQDLLTESELEKYNAGNSLEKELYLYYGYNGWGMNPLEANSYSRSLGYYYLSFEISQNKIKLLSFLKN